MIKKLKPLISNFHNKGLIFFYLIFFILFTNSVTFSKINVDELKDINNCEGNNINNYNLLSNAKIKALEINIVNNKKWTTNIIRAITGVENSLRYHIHEKYKKKFKSIIKIFYNNDLSCAFKAKVAISGDIKDHLKLQNGQAI